MAYPSFKLVFDFQPIVGSRQVGVGYMHTIIDLEGRLAEILEVHFVMSAHTWMKLAKFPQLYATNI